MDRSTAVMNLAAALAAMIEVCINENSRVAQGPIQLKAEVPAPAPAPAPTKPRAAPPAAAKDTATDPLRDAAIKFIGAFSAAELTTFLKSSFGVPKLSEVPADRRDEAIAQLANACAAAAAKAWAAPAAAADPLA